MPPPQDFNRGIVAMPSFQQSFGMSGMSQDGWPDCEQRRRVVLEGSAKARTFVHEQPTGHRLFSGFLFLGLRFEPQGLVRIEAKAGRRSFGHRALL